MKVAHSQQHEYIVAVHFGLYVKCLRLVLCAGMLLASPNPPGIPLSPQPPQQLSDPQQVKINKAPLSAAAHAPSSAGLLMCIELKAHT